MRNDDYLLDCGSGRQHVKIQKRLQTHDAKGLLRIQPTMHALKLSCRETLSRLRPIKTRRLSRRSPGAHGRPIPSSEDPNWSSLRNRIFYWSDQTFGKVERRKVLFDDLHVNTLKGVLVRGPLQAQDPFGAENICPFGLQKVSEPVIDFFEVKITLNFNPDRRYGCIMLMIAILRVKEGRKEMQASFGLVTFEGIPGLEYTPTHLQEVWFHFQNSRQIKCLDPDNLRWKKRERLI